MNESVSNYYDAIADEYDFITSTTGNWKAPNVVSMIFSELIKDNFKVLDIGIGTGKSIEALVNSGLSLEIHGLDISANMLQICSNKFKDIYLYHGDIFTTDFEYLFDLIVCCGAFEFISNPDEFICRVARLLKPNGYFIFTFEPLLKDNVYQETTSTTRYFTVNDGVISYLSYRSSKGDIFTLLNKYHFCIMKYNDFVAYTVDSNSGSTVINSAICARKN